jgi:hypothetical protein
MVFERFWIECSDEAYDAGLITDEDGKYHWEPGKAPTRWRSGRFMPRLASRLMMRIKDVRVERVQDISEEDAKAEGLKFYDPPFSNRRQYYIPRHLRTFGTGDDAETLQYTGRGYTPKPIEAFIGLWNSINHKRGHGWDLNPWVWALSFDVIKKNVDEYLKEKGLT